MKIHQELMSCLCTLGFETSSVLWCFRRRTRLIRKTHIKHNHLTLDPNMSQVNVLIQNPIRLFFSADEKHPLVWWEKQQWIFPPEIYDYELSLLWLYISTVWLPVLQQLPPGCAESLAEPRSAVKQACVWTVWQLCPPVLCAFIKTQPGGRGGGDQKRSHLQG